MRNPINTYNTKDCRGRRIIKWTAELYGFEADGATQEEAEQNLLDHIRKVSRTSSTPESVSVGEYTSLVWFESSSARWVYSIIEGDGRDLRNFHPRATCQGYSNNCDCRAQAISHMASLQIENMESLVVSHNGGKTVRESLEEYYPELWDNLKSLMRHHRLRAIDAQ